MCDFSLESVARRDAKANDVLELDKLTSMYGSQGFRAADDKSVPPTAVCLKCNTLLHIDYPDGKCDVGVFGQNDVSFGYRDQIVMTNGQTVSLQNLPRGTKATVLMLADKNLVEETKLAGEGPLPGVADYDLAYIG